jgi:hypothetical protein
VDLSVEHVFERRLATLDLEEGDVALLKAGFAEICARLSEESPQPEDWE